MWQPPSSKENTKNLLPLCSSGSDNFPYWPRFNGCPPSFNVRSSGLLQSSKLNTPPDVLQRLRIVRENQKNVRDFLSLEKTQSHLDLKFKRKLERYFQKPEMSEKWVYFPRWNWMLPPSLLLFFYRGDESLNEPFVSKLIYFVLIRVWNENRRKFNGILLRIWMD